MTDRKTKEQTEKKRLKEQETAGLMIKLYCRGVHGGESLCDECRELLEYSKKKSDNCPFMEEKTFCSNCSVHCYNPEMRERIKKVMRYSGPRMIFHHPLMAMQHLYYSVKEKREILKKG